MSIKRAGYGCHPDYLDQTNFKDPSKIHSAPLPPDYQRVLDGKLERPFPSKDALKGAGPTGSAHYKRRS